MADSVNIGGMWVELGAQLKPFIEGMKAGKVGVKDFSDTTDKAMNDVGRSMKKGETATKSFIETHKAGLRTAGLALSAFGAAVLGVLGSTVKSFAAYGDELDEMSTRTGIATQWLSRFGFMADITGGNLGGLETSVKKMQKT